MSKTSPIVVLDPGHGPKGNPYPAASGFYEGTQMYKLMLLVKSKLESNGVTVITTRKNVNMDPSLPERGKTAGNNKADMFISLHSDAAGSGGIYSATGVSVYYSIFNEKENKEFASTLAQRVSALMGTRNRGAMTRIGNGGLDYYGVIRNSASSGCKRAFLIEHGFHTSLSDVKWLIDDVKLDKIADVDASVICEFFGIDYKSSTSEKPSVDVNENVDSSDSKTITIHKPLAKYVSAANAIEGNPTLSVGLLAAGTYYVYKTYGDATNLTKTRGTPGSWVVIGDAASMNNDISISDNIPELEKITIDKSYKVYTSSENAITGNNPVTKNGEEIRYEPGEYYVYKKINADIINISKKPDTAGAWINLKSANDDTIISFNKGDIVVFATGSAPRYTDGSIIPTVVISTVNGKCESVVVSVDGDAVTITEADKPVPANILKVILKANDKSIAKANAYSSSEKIDKDDIAKVLEAKFGALSILAGTNAFKDFVDYMEGLIDDDTEVDPLNGVEFIMGNSVLNPIQLTNYIRKYNPNFETLIAKSFIEIGKIYGIRGDVACCQSILETGWFKFIGSSVKPEQHNYCGLGATGGGVAGCSFDTIEKGVEAQIQHLFAYACKLDVPSGRTLYDPRFKYVARGIAPRWVDLNLRWCTGSDYGEKILEIYRKALI